MRSLKLFSPLLLSCLLAPAISPAQTLTVDEKQQLLNRMNSVYYNATAQGFKGMECSADSDWKAYFAQMPEVKSHPEKLDEIVKNMQKVSTQVFVDANGHARARTNVPDEVFKSSMGAGIDTTTTGINQAIQGYFLSWAAFAMDKPFPYKADETTLKSTGDGYQLSFTSGDTSVEGEFSKDLVLQHLWIDTSRMKVSEAVTFMPTAAGQILESMEADEEMKPSGKMPHVTMSSTYQAIGGVQVPYVLTLKVDMANVPPFIVTLNNCKLTQ